ncbi:MAG TPA: thermonuclease family protein [Candidatus Paceibacterota bacterium]|nr:thermonuclease family protein [Candidatus Paceibacterota bacterium]
METPELRSFLFFRKNSHLRRNLKWFFALLVFAFLISFFGNSSPQPPQPEVPSQKVTSQTATTSPASSLASSSPTSGSLLAEEKQTKPETETEVSETQVPTSDPKLEQPASGLKYTVTKVVDGDTIKIDLNGKEETLRLIGMDTPETVDPRKPVQCFGREASNEAKALLTGRKVRIAADPTQDIRDKYGRLLVYVWRDDGLFYNQYMIEQGYAHEYTYYVPYEYQADFKQAEQDARENERGLWSPSTCDGNTTQAAK